MGIVPEVALNSGHQMPLVGLGTVVYPLLDAEKQLIAPILCAIRNGYRHFDTASLYQTEQALGEAIKEALRLGLVKSRTQLFITSKLWCSDSHQDLVLPALKKTLQNLQTDYLDLYLVHLPLSSMPGKPEFPIRKEDFLPMDFGSVWAAMEECQRLGLTKSIGVSNFSSKKIEKLLTTAKITPAVNQVEMNPICQQKKLREFCKAKSIVVTACAPLGAGSNSVMGNDVLKEIAKAKGKTSAQVTLRWLYEQGVSLLPKSFNEGRMKENLDIFDWTLSEAESKQISQLPQGRVGTGDWLLSDEGPFKSLEELWDEDI